MGLVKSDNEILSYWKKSLLFLGVLLFSGFAATGYFVTGFLAFAAATGPDTAQFYYSPRNRAVITDGITLGQKGVYQLSFPDNLRVYSLEQHDEPMATARIFIRHQVDLSSLERGYASIFERMVHNALTNKKGSALTFLQASGATFRSHVEREYSSYEIRISVNLFEKALEHLKKWIFDVKMNEENFKRARQKLLTHSIKAWNDPSLRALNTIDSIFNSPFMSSCGIKGNPGLLKDASLEGLKHFYNNNFRTSNSVIILAGDFIAEEASHLAGDIFSLHDFQKKGGQTENASIDADTVRKIEASVQDFTESAPELVSVNVDSEATSVMACWPGVRYSDPRSCIIDFLAFLSTKLPDVKGYSITPVFNRGILAFEYKKNFQTVDYIHINEVLDYLKSVPEKLKSMVISDKFKKYKREFFNQRDRGSSRDSYLDSVIFHAGVSGMINRFSALSHLLQDHVWERDLENDGPDVIAELCDSLLDPSRASFVISGPISKIEEAFASDEYEQEGEELSNDPDSRIMNILFPDLPWNAGSIMSTNTLSNGLRVVRQESDLVSQISFYIIIDGGRRKETAPYAGISDVAAAVLADSFSGQFKLQAVSGQDFICLKLMVPETEAEKAAEIVKKAVTYRAAGPSNLEKIKKAMGLYTEQFKKSVFHEALSRLNDILFIGASGIPDLSSKGLLKIDASVVKEYIASMIRPENISVSVKYNPRVSSRIEKILNSFSSLKPLSKVKPFGKGQSLVQTESFVKLKGKVIDHEAPIGNYENFFFVFKGGQKFVTSRDKKTGKTSEDINPEYAALRLAAEIIKDEFIRNLAAEGLLHDPSAKPWFTEVKGIFTFGVCLKKGYLKRADKILTTLLEIAGTKGFEKDERDFALSRITASESRGSKNLYYQAQGYYARAFKEIEEYHTALYKLIDATGLQAVKKAASIIKNNSFRMNVVLEKKSLSTTKNSK